MKNLNLSEPLENCIICDFQLSQSIRPKVEFEELIFLYSCDNCNFFGEIDIHTARDLDRYSDKIHILLGYLRDLKEYNRGIGRLTLDKLKDIISSAGVPRNVNEKLDRILLFLEKYSDHPGVGVNLYTKKDYTIAYAKNAEEFEYLLEQLLDRGLIEGPPHKDSVSYKLTLDGWNELDRIRRYKRDTKQVFVAMWFNDDMKNVYESGINKAIKECGYDTVRVDLIQHNEKIDDRIIAEIKKSAFLVADFTGHRGGVYFEAGYAMGLGLPVIWLCKKEDIEDTHFDTRQYNHIVWENEDVLYEKLKARIEATIVKY